MRLKNAKAKGSRIEREGIAQLESEGYACTKAGGSLGMWDVIAISEKEIKLIQFKANRWPGRIERAGMKACRVPRVVSKEIWRRDDGVREFRIVYL